MKVLLKGSDGNEVASTVIPQCAACFSSLCAKVTKAKHKCTADGRNRRLGSMSSECGSVYLCSPLADDLNSSRVFNSRLLAYLEVIGSVQTIKTDVAAGYNQKLDRLMHNLTSLNAHCIQELFDFVSQDALTMNIGQQIKFVQDAMKASPPKAAKTFLRIAKNNLAMKSEFVAMRFFDTSAPHPKLREHAIRKVVLNVLHAFFQDFNDHGVRVTVGESAATAMLDYDTFHVAIYHIIDNATKYIMPHSEMNVRFAVVAERVKVDFDMLSLPIPDDEAERIGEEGFSGSIAKSLQLSGHGMGMFRTKRLLAANNGEMTIEANLDPNKATSHNGIEYQQNVFSVAIAEAQKRDRSPSRPR